MTRREKRDGDSNGATKKVSDDSRPLAAVVGKDRTGVAINSLKAEGVYDDSRRVREFDEGTISVPVTEAPAETRVREIVRQVDPEYRLRDPTDWLAERGWDEAALETVPGSWAVIGSVVLVTVPEDCPDETELGEALLEVHGEADTVLADEGIETAGRAGRFRTPRTRHIAGSRNTETIHTEHGTRYALDPTRVMFSPGNVAERVRMGAVVESGERVFDMFAGIGYFTLPMARAGGRVTATELNPTAFKYLVENAALNDVGDRIDAYLSDCRELASTVDADRVVLGYYGYDGSDSESTDEGGTQIDEIGQPTRTEQGWTFLEHALVALRSGGVLHYHEAVPESGLWDVPIDRLESAVADANGDRTVEVIGRHRVKSYSPGVSHVVLDAVVH